MKVRKHKDANGNIASVSQPWWPVGSIYLSVNTTNPSSYFGGTWEQIAKGRTLVGVDTSQTEFNTAEKTGGEKKHKLTINEMPSHAHGNKVGWTTGTAEAIDYSQNNGTNSLATNFTGGDQAHNNLQPYFTCYIWLRTG